MPGCLQRTPAEVPQWTELDVTTSAMVEALDDERKRAQALCVLELMTEAVAQRVRTRPRGYTATEEALEAYLGA